MYICKNLGLQNFAPSENREIKKSREFSVTG